LVGYRCDEGRGFSSVPLHRLVRIPDSSRPPAPRDRDAETAEKTPDRINWMNRITFRPVNPVSVPSLSFLGVHCAFARVSSSVFEQRRGAVGGAPCETGLFDRP